MSLVWHIVRKDFRRLRWPLAAWLALPLAQWTLMSASSGTAMDPAAFEGMITMSNVWIGLTWATGVILVAWLVMEDGLVSTQAFWRTRPISGARLLAAKGLGAALMFGILPVMVMTPVWLTVGFSGREWGLAAAELFSKHAIFTVVAFALACVTETGGQFLVRLIGTLILGPLILGYGAGIFGGLLAHSGDGLAESRYRLVVGVFIATPLVMIGHQYLTRRRLRSYALLGVGVALMFALRLGWQWDWTPAFRQFPTNTTAPHQEIKLTPGPLALEPQPEGPVKLLLSGTTAGAPSGTYVRVTAMRAWWSEGAGHRPGARIVLGTESFPLERATRQVAGLSEGPEEAQTWSAFGMERAETLARARENSARLAVAVNAVLLRGRVVGELPLHAGAELQSGASRTRITGLERVEGRVVVWLEERSARPPWSWNNRSQDSFLLSNPAVAPEAGYTPIRTERSLEFASISLCQRQLIIPVPLHEVNGRIVEVPGWEESARLVKVTFSPESWFTPILPLELPAATR